MSRACLLDYKINLEHAACKHPFKLVTKPLSTKFYEPATARRVLSAREEAHSRNKMTTIARNIYDAPQFRGNQFDGSCVPIKRLPFWLVKKQISRNLDNDVVSFCFASLRSIKKRSLGFKNAFDPFLRSTPRTLGCGRLSCIPGWKIFQGN